MAALDDYTELGLVGYTYEGSYSATKTYNRYNCVEHEGSTYVALKDNLTGTTPSNDGTNWKYLARGFQKEDAKHITIIDKDNYVGSGENEEVILQTWADKVADDLQTADENITTLQSGVSTNASNISAETTRAEGVEETHTNAISAINTKIGTDDFSALATSVSAGLVVLQNFKGTTDISSLSIPTVSEMVSLLQGVGEAAKTGAAGFHNCIYRGKYLGSSVTAAQWATIKAGKFDDLYIGDYWTIGGVNYRIAAFDYYYNTGDTACTSHHVVLVPDSPLYSAQMNTSNITTGAYVGSTMYTSNLATAKSTIKSAFGSDHILKHRNHLRNAVTNGYESGGSWYDSEVELMTEQNVYGSQIFTNSTAGTNWANRYVVDKSQYPLFTYRPDMISAANRSWYWLRGVANASAFTNVSGYGLCDALGASYSYGVRPAFSIY